MGEEEGDGSEEKGRERERNEKGEYCGVQKSLNRPWGSAAQFYVKPSSCRDEKDIHGILNMFRASS